MAILNVTPDSFSDGGDTLDPQRAIAAARQMIADGAHLIDIGGESSRPGSDDTPAEVEQGRILPVIAGLRGCGVPLSVDTRRAAAMRLALDAGATVINDVSALQHDAAAARLVAERGCPVILMHMRGTARTMNGLAHYGDVVGDVAAELASRMAAAVEAGVRPEQIALDPGFGFAKVGEQNVTLLRRFAELQRLGRPLVAGLSRKRFIGELTGRAAPKERGAGSLAASLFALGSGARVLRVHDVAATVQAVQVWQALAP